MHAETVGVVTRGPNVISSGKTTSFWMPRMPANAYQWGGGWGLWGGGGGRDGWQRQLHGLTKLALPPFILTGSPAVERCTAAKMPFAQYLDSGAPPPVLAVNYYEVSPYTVIELLFLSKQSTVIRLLLQIMVITK